MLSSFEQRVLDLINSERAKVQLDPLRVNEQLSNAAEYHSISMAEDDFFSHRGIDGSSPFDRIREEGYRFRSAGENIAAGQNTPEAVVKGWMNSSGHRANILSTSFTEIGIGYDYNQFDTGQVNYSHYWTTTFASPLG